MLDPKLSILTKIYCSMSKINKIMCWNTILIQKSYSMYVEVSDYLSVAIIFHNFSKFLLGIEVFKFMILLINRFCQDKY